MRYLGQEEARALDVELFSKYQFSVEQLMELAGLSVAVAVARCFPARTHPRVLTVCGPGNNGGDGLVAARHLAHFGYESTVWCARRPLSPLHERLLAQCVQSGVREESTPPPTPRDSYDHIVDALFGFSFRPPVREELRPALRLLIESDLPTSSVDIPSGWDVEHGPPMDIADALQPALLVSLSAPKLCARPELIGNALHFLGGRFVPPELAARMQLALPSYPEQEQVVRLA
ncbi:NAD(P)H-hydrate epimerase [Eumeta japonica]|uniref:NAD(P)H-hydrate epimerase n=1 Tax=Eumeta variegata TaxID=151549 RepID=A0A4C1XCS0_EUMVA|nr:NAD(P)H-hydrate epimerase [Eumeta japonica]